MGNNTIINENYKVSGMTCASCASSLESYLGATSGVQHAMVNYPNQSAEITYDTSVITLHDLEIKTKEIGYQLVTGNEAEIEISFDRIQENRHHLLGKKLILSIVFTLPLFIYSMFFMGSVPFENWIMFTFSLPVMFWSGSEFFVNAWRQARHFSTGMDTLVALSTGVAFLFSIFNTIYPSYFTTRGMMPHVYYESATMIITLILLGRFLEDRAKGKTSSAIKKLMGLQPNEVIVIRNGEEQLISLKEVIVGELIILKPGDRVPVDGKVKKGGSYIDESMITGEPFPVVKGTGDPVHAGTINQNGTLRIFAEKIGKDTLLAQIIALVKNAQASKPPIQKFVDKIAGIFVPVVIIISLVTFGAWMIWGPSPSFSHAIWSLITVLIIACPCALGLATPTALMVGIGKGAGEGILIKDAQSLETTYKINTLVLDKTGTITEGKPTVIYEEWDKNIDNNKFQRALFSIESQSEHPVATAICNYYHSRGVEKQEVDKFENIVGKGAQATIADSTYLTGSLPLMKERKVHMPLTLIENAQLRVNKGETIIFMSYEGQLKGFLSVADQVKKNAKDAISTLHRLGIEVYMLTGDHEKAAQKVTEEVGIKHYRANVQPTDKGFFVKKLQQQGKIVAMAGDGINDAHALAQANVGIAMASGTDIAIESASITLIHSDLAQIAKAITLSKNTMRTVRQNLFWAFIYNIIAIPVAAGLLYPFWGYLLNPMIAGAAMSMSSVSVVTNSLRLGNKKL